MESKILQVFYGNDALPYKDKERTVHYPIVGNAFQGAQNTTQIRFYYNLIGSSNTTWVAVSKLPNGKIGSKVLQSSYDSEIGENYAQLDLSGFYTQYKGDLFISLQGYQGGVEVEYDEDEEIYEIIGTPTIQATGSIKLSINYATQFVGSGEEENVDLQQLLGELSNYLKIVNGIVVIDSSSEDISGYSVGQVFYDIYSKHFLVKNSSEQLEPYDLVPFNQATVSIIASPTQTITGKTFTHYTSEYGTYGTEPNVFYAYKIKYDNENCNEQQAREYMAYMSGSNYLPKYNYDRPANSYFLQPNGQLLKPQYDQTNGLLLIVMKQLAMQDYVDDTYLKKTDAISNYVPYSGANKNVDLGNHTISAKTFEIKGFQAGITNIDGESITLFNYDGDIYLEPYGKVYYAPINGVASEIATYTQVTSAQTTLQANIDASGHSLAISGGANTDYTYTITLKDSNNNTLSSITFDLPLESVVVSGTYDSVNQEIVLTLEDGSTIPIPVGDLVSGLVSQSDFNSLSATVTTNNNNAFKYNDITIIGGYVGALKKNNVDYPVAQNVDVTTTPKVVATTSDLPSTNDGFLYLVIANGYLYYWDTNTNDWAQGYEYATDISLYVPITRTIAGINLSNDISAQALTDALVFMNNTTDLEYVMED